MTAIIKEEFENQDEYYEYFRIEVDRGQEPLRIDKFVMSRLEKVSRSRIQNAILAGSLLVNDNETKANYKVRPKDLIRIVLPRNPDFSDEVIAENIPLDIVYEDDHLMVVNKPAGLVVHPGIGNYTGTLVNALAFYFQNRELPLLKGNHLDRPGIVHRIDKDTSGLLLVAKTDFAMSHLAKQFYNHSIDRSYLALVWGNFDEPEGTIDQYIGRHPNERLRMHVFEDEENGKKAVTHYKLIKDYYYVSLVECKLETGRTHQIRVHMKHLGHPVFNDSRYDGSRIVKGTVYTNYRRFVENCFELCPRQALHAKSLGFIHPATSEKVYFEIDPPEDMTACIQKWEGYFDSKLSKMDH